MKEGRFPSGWVLLQGSLIRRGGDYDARLCYDLGVGFKDDQYFEIPSSSKGVINELLPLPANIKHIKFLLMGTAGEFELCQLSIAKVGALERIWRMVRRVVPMIFLHSRQKRKLIKLTFFRMLVDLQGTYKIAGKLRAHAAAPPYQNWIEQFDELTADDRTQINKHITRFANTPHFHLLIMADDTASGAVQKTLDSLNGQLYRHFTCVLLDMTARDSGLITEMQDMAWEVTRVAQPRQAAWLEQFNTELADGKAHEWVLLVRAGDVFAPHALYRFAREALAKPEAAVLYSDDDELDGNGQRRLHRFKPDWSLTHLRSTNFPGDAVALRGGEVAKAGGVGVDCCRYGTYDLLLRMVDVVGDAGTGRVAHIPAVLLHRGGAPLPDPLPGGERGLEHMEWNDPQWCVEALRAHLARNGVKGDVVETLPGCWRVRYELPDVPPLVSIVVPTRDAFELIRQCVGSLLDKTTYPRFEILVVDNQSADADALAYLERIAGHQRVRVLRYDLPFNYSAMNNMAVREARGEVVCLLNNDTEVISPDWLEEMVGHLLQPGVGVVGAKLYFPNGQVQHGGDLVGVGGVANHAHAFLQRHDPGYCNRAMVAQEFSAVTGACLVTWKEIYQRLGGLDEQHLKVAFNDVDYCLRVREAGYRVMWTPHAELYHHESVSRGKDCSPEKKKRAKREVAYVRKRWKHVMRHDPFYNPNLSHERPDFSLSNAPMVRKPWESRE
ncbi:MAG: hypothetical protein A3H31_03205 [Gallionellales bacterium RIFCSPLOWO2_02_FULL_57_47]|nr:MAG: hypothetical protein A3H31_03205 [Gallionellales bacterium RIFCSPLOWO2_02_FULL_57_47]